MIGAGVRERRKGEAKMSDCYFVDPPLNDEVKMVLEYLQELKACKPFTPDERGNMRRDGKPLPKIKGVYCFYEGNKFVYAGTTYNIRRGVLSDRKKKGFHKMFVRFVEIQDFTEQQVFTSYAHIACVDNFGNH